MIRRQTPFGCLKGKAMHGPRFKKLLQEFFAELFWLFFPSWAERFDFGSVEWLDKELMSDALAAESRG